MRVPPAAVAAVLIAFGMIRMAATFRVFSATVDEATHVGAGLELLEYHRYRFQRENPPLPRLVLSAAPWAGGMRYDPRGDLSAQLHSIFYGHGEYKANLARARAGNLVFFAIAAVALFYAARDALGDEGALLALFLFTMQPIVLGYSALATHDGAGVAGVAVALVAFARWLRRPRLQSALLFGAAYGFSILCKFSCIAFVALACAGMAIVRLLHDGNLRRQAPRAAATLLPAAAVTLFTIWAGYAFTVRTVGELVPLSDAFGPQVHRLLAHLDHRTPLPAPDFFAGVAGLLRIDQGGFQTFLCGKVTTSGWWWYFPFAIVMKSTIATLLLVLVGSWFVARDRKLRWACAEWSVAALCVVAVAMPSTLDLGIRYILPFYVAISVVAAAAALAMFRASRVSAAVAIALLAGHLAASFAAHPDYFPYFNAFGGRDPSLYLIDSNLDWGQDILRLRSVVRREHIESLSLSLMGSADYRSLSFPPVTPAEGWLGSHGWVAISDHSYRMGGAQGAWRWLPDKYRRVGKSIRLYHVP
jgi:4-amino-4-deoxy-L-arabinose transferase-like glycosyltransferase